MEFVGGEGPDQLLDRIQSRAIPLIRKAQETRGRFLRWQHLEKDTGVIRRHRSPLNGQLRFELSDDERAIELLLHGKSSPAHHDPVPLRPRVPLTDPANSDDPAPGTAMIDWTVEPPLFSWRYRHRGKAIVLEMTWSCPTLPPAWAEQLRQQHPRLHCQCGSQLTVEMAPSSDGPLTYHGELTLNPPVSQATLPAVLAIYLRQPVVLWSGQIPKTSDSSGPDTAPSNEVRARVPVSLEARSISALVQGRRTRWITDEDLDEPFQAEVLTASDVLLPGRLPAGVLRGVPWPLTVTPDDAPPDDGLPPVGRRWRISAQPPDAPDAASDKVLAGSWREIRWQPSENENEPRLRFGLGVFDRQEAPFLQRVRSRQAVLSWRLEGLDNDTTDTDLLCLAEPRWTSPERLGLSLAARGAGSSAKSGEGAENSPVAEISLGAEAPGEWLRLDASSELPWPRLHLDPQHWRFYDANGEVSDGEALGEVQGHVRWRRPEQDTDLAPAAWASGNAPVLLMRRSDARSWGGLYCPEPVPWDALAEVPPEATPNGTLLNPSSPVDSLWIDLQGYLTRYDRQRFTFLDTFGEVEVTAWLARVPLPVFPRERSFLLRSFAPFHAVRSPFRHLLQLTASHPRPVLAFGRDLDTSGPQLLDVGPDTRLRYHLADTPAEMPDVFGPGRIPGSRLRLPGVRPHSLWLALETDPASGFLISWSAEGGWQLRGFFHSNGTAVRLGVDEDGREIRLGADPGTDGRSFRLTLNRGEAAWSREAPEHVVRQVNTSEIAAWERGFFAPENRPDVLRSYGFRVVTQPDETGPWVFELSERSAGEDPSAIPSGIRAWELQPGAEAEPSKPKPKLLRADPDDFF